MLTRLCTPADATTTPPEHAPFYDEKLLMTHGTYMLNYHREARGEVLSERPAGLARASLGAYLRSQGSALFYFDADGFNRSLEGFSDDEVRHRIKASWRTGASFAGSLCANSWVCPCHLRLRFRWEPGAPARLCLRFCTLASCRDSEGRGLG